jgi:hypothetical protein
VFERDATHCPSRGEHVTVTRTLSRVVDRVEAYIFNTPLLACERGPSGYLHGTPRDDLAPHAEPQPRCLTSDTSRLYAAASSPSQGSFTASFADFGSGATPWCYAYEYDGIRLQRSRGKSREP